MSKLMIINCAADTSMHDGVEKRFHDSEVLASSVKKGWEAGSCIAHIHAPPTNYEFIICRRSVDMSDTRTCLPSFFNGTR